MTIRELIENKTITLDTEVLGTLVMTKDNCIVGHNAEIHWPHPIRNNCKTDPIWHEPSFTMVMIEEGYCDHSVPNADPFVCWGGPENDSAKVGELFSSRQAALAARGGGA